MATPQALRKQTSNLTALAVADLDALWQRTAGMRYEQRREVLSDVMPALVEQYGLAAATLAADWYDANRESAEVRGRFVAEPVELGNLGVTSLVGWGMATGTSPESSLALISGGMVRRINNASRDTIKDNAIVDPAAEGWQRVGVGSCDFCRMLISRGAVYSESTADFASHDSCHCSAAPAYKGKPRPVKPVKDWRGANPQRSKADQQRVREWIAAHK